MYNRQSILCDWREVKNEIEIWKKTEHWKLCSLLFTYLLCFKILILFYIHISYKELIFQKSIFVFFSEYILLYYMGHCSNKVVLRTGGIVY